MIVLACRYSDDRALYQKGSRTHLATITSMSHSAVGLGDFLAHLRRPVRLRVVAAATILLRLKRRGDIGILGWAFGGEVLGRAVHDV